jgi:DNA-binding NarL/FixJ family response regulator
LGQEARAARLLGAAEAAHAAGFTPTVPGFEQAYRATTEAVAAALAPDTFTAEAATGAGLSVAAVVAEAESLLGESAARTRLATASTDGLSQREVEVLRLLASGRSNAEIADELVLSVRTVEKHVANIYGKIGARGRADAATYALRHGLLAT